MTKKFYIALGCVVLVIGAAITGKLLMEDIELSNGLWWGGLAIIASLLLLLDWLGGDDK
jgi:hypothetical protein